MSCTRVRIIGRARRNYLTDGWAIIFIPRVVPHIRSFLVFCVEATTWNKFPDKIGKGFLTKLCSLRCPIDDKHLKRIAFINFLIISCIDGLLIALSSSYYVIFSQEDQCNLYGELSISFVIFICSKIVCLRIKKPIYEDRYLSIVFLVQLYSIQVYYTRKLLKMKQETKSKIAVRYNVAGHKNLRFIFWHNLFQLQQAQNVTSSYNWIAFDAKLMSRDYYYDKII